MPCSIWSMPWEAVQEHAVFLSCRSRRCSSERGPECREALEDGQIDVERLREICVQFAPLPEKDQVVFLGIDTSNLYRPEAETAADRTLVKMANLPAKTHVASPGWVISSVVLLPRQASQGTFVLDTVRVRSTEQATEVAARQLRAVVALLVTRGLHPIILGDRWYACAPLLARMTDVDASSLSKAIASFTARPQSGSPDKREPAARMGSVFNAAMNAPMANPMKPGKAPMTKVQRSRFVAGTTCTCAPLVGWNFRSFRSSAMEPAEASVIPGSAGLSGKATSRLRWPRSAQSTACVTLTSMAITSTSRNGSGTLHGSRQRIVLRSNSSTTQFLGFYYTDYALAGNNASEYS